MVYVDDMYAKYRGMLMCHMIADTKEELLAMVDTIGVQRKWIQKEDTTDEHFDICKTKRALAVSNGAQEVTVRELVSMIGKKRLKLCRHVHPVDYDKLSCKSNATIKKGSRIMSERKLTEKTCDQCGDTSTSCEGKFGNHPHAGWFDLKQMSRRIHHNRIDGDFCTPKCLVDYVIEKAKLPYVVIERDDDDADMDYEDMDIHELRKECGRRRILSDGGGILVNHTKKGKLILALERWDEERSGDSDR